MTDRRIAFIVGILAFPSLIASPTAVSAEEDPGEEAEVESHSTAVSLDADLEFARESVGSESAGEFTFDEVGIALEGRWWTFETGIKYRTEGGRGLVIEEAALQIGPTEEFPVFLLVGRTVLPFGTFESSFIEDPFTVAAGETDDDTIVLGVERDAVSASIGILSGSFAGQENVDLVAALRIGREEALRADVYWTSDIGEAVELRELRGDFLEEADASAALPAAGEEHEHPVDGWAVSASWNADAFRVLGEFVTALHAFDSGILSGRPLRPSAWNMEIALRPRERLEIAGRWEGSRNLPQTPKHQAGIGASCTLSENATASAEFLRGFFAGEGPDAHLWGLKLALSF